MTAVMALLSGIVSLVLLQLAAGIYAVSLGAILAVWELPQVIIMMYVLLLPVCITMR